VIRTMCDEISISNSEIWQLQGGEPSIDVLLNIIYRKCLGVESSTCTSAVRHELGVSSQRLQTDAQALKFRNNILRLDDDHIVKRVYLGLKDEQLVGFGDTKNGVRGHLERFARTANWLGQSSEKPAAKDAVKEHVETRQNALFKDDLNQKSTLRELRKVER